MANTPRMQLWIVGKTPEAGELYYGEDAPVVVRADSPWAAKALAHTVVPLRGDATPYGRPCDWFETIVPIGEGAGEPAIILHLVGAA